MNNLVGYGSDDENETERFGSYTGGGSSGGAGGSKRREDDTNYDDVNMDMSEDSQAESEPELPPADAPKSSRRDQRSTRDREERPDRPDRRRESPKRGRREPSRDDRHNRSDRGDRHRHEGSSRRTDDKPADSIPSLLDVKTHIGDGHSGRSQDVRDVVSPRFVDRRERERERDRARGRRSEERDRDRGRASGRRHDRERSRDRSREKSRERSRGKSRERSRGKSRDESRDRSRGRVAYPPPSNTRNSPPSNEYRPSYKVNKKLEVMEKMGLQIKTPDGSMATAQQLRLAAADAPAASPAGLPSYYGPGAPPARLMQQVHKRKLLWSNKKASEAEEAAKWSGARFSQDTDGRQASKFMRLMGIKDATAVKPPTEEEADPNKKQKELFDAMQAQYEVARATTHTMRGVGLGFQRPQI